MIQWQCVYGWRWAIGVIGDLFLFITIVEKTEMNREREWKDGWNSCNSCEWHLHEIKIFMNHGQYGLKWWFNSTKTPHTTSTSGHRTQVMLPWNIKSHREPTDHITLRATPHSDHDCRPHRYATCNTTRLSHLQPQPHTTIKKAALWSVKHALRLKISAI